MRGLLALAVLLAGAVASGCSDTETIPEGDPRTRFRNDLRGYKARPGIIIGKDMAAYWVQQAVSGYRDTTPADMPANIKLERPVERCAFDAPEGDEQVANVHVNRSPMPTPIYAFSRQDLSKRTKRWIAIYQKEGKKREVSVADPGGDAMRAIDVVITETSAPIYLVLQSEWSNVLWNIHAADGVKLSRIAVLGSGSVGVANVDLAVPMQFMSAATLARCRVMPVREPAKHWVFVKRVRSGVSGDLSDKLAENQQKHRTYSKWFASNFGIASETDVIGLNEASQVLVGPLPVAPEARVAYRPLKGAQVRMTREDYVLVSEKSEYRASHDKLVRDLAVEAAGGDLSSLVGG